MLKCVAMEFRKQYARLETGHGFGNLMKFKICYKPPNKQCHQAPISLQVRQNKFQTLRTATPNMRYVL